MKHREINKNDKTKKSNLNSVLHFCRNVTFGVVLFFVFYWFWNNTSSNSSQPSQRKKIVEKQRPTSSESTKPPVSDNNEINISENLTKSVFGNSKHNTIENRVKLKVNIPQMGTSERLRYEIKQVLKDSNRGIVEIQKNQNANDIIKITFRVDDNITERWIKKGAKIDITKILKAIKISGYNYSEVRILGIFELVDKYGNSEEGLVVKAYYTSDTINKVNWQNFLYDDIYAIADYFWLHPAFE